jgi:uncharacterized protein
MSQKIDQDHSRFRQIVKGRVKKELRKYMSRGDMIGKKGKDKVSIPIHSIDLPRFKYTTKDSGGVGQGEGEVGDSLGGDPEQGEGQGKAGNQEGQHSLEVEFSLDDLAKLIGEELELPNIKPRGTQKILSPNSKYTGIRKIGPESLRHFKRTYREALKRQIVIGNYNKKNPIIIPIKEDKRYRSWKESYIPKTNAVIIYIMDVSGSMGEEQKTLVRIESFWIDTWLRYQYEGIESRYIIHDTKAKEVDKDTFYRTKESGGTIISSAYNLCKEMIEKDYSDEEWNIYAFHFSDGDNWSRDDSSKCFTILRENLFNTVNMFGYGQVKSPYGSGQFYDELVEAFPEEDALILSKIPNREAILDSIKDFLGKGK